MTEATAIIIAAIAGVASYLTATMFHTRNSILGFPSGIFWAVLGGFLYQQHTTTWDIYYIAFFASMGMLIFSVYAAFSLRKKDLEPKKSDWLDSGKLIDEGSRKPKQSPVWKETTPNEEDDLGWKSKPSRRTLELHRRVEERKTQRYGL